MNDHSLNPIVFHLIGDIERSGLGDAAGLDLRPALFAGYADLNKLRYDFPVVLGQYDNDFARSLSDITNDIIDEIAPPGGDGEFARTEILRLEREIRTVATRNGPLPLTKAWASVARTIHGRAAEDVSDSLGECLEAARDALHCDGRLVNCDADAPVALVRQAWAIDQKAKCYDSRKRVDELILKLGNILGAETWKTEATLSSESLKGSVGASFEKAFDFDVMSEMLTPSRPHEPLPSDRRRRITWALRTLQSQKFFVSEKWSEKTGRRNGYYAFLFKSAASARKAIRERIPEMVELIKAVSIAELEIANLYDRSKHDAFFNGFGEDTLLPEDLAFFPSYLVVLDGKRLDANEKGRILDLLSLGLPVKVLAKTDDILTGLLGEEGPLPSGGLNWQLASMAVGLNNVFVFQSAAANLYRHRHQIEDGLAYAGPSLFSIFSGGRGGSDGLAPYLVSAAAVESRAFPSFHYDPGAGRDWASRLSIDGNPQPEKDWPRHHLSYEDADMQRTDEETEFTFIDFVAADRRFAKFFATMPDGQSPQDMVPASDYMALSKEKNTNAVPYINMVDADNRLHRLVVNECLIRAARSCLDMWRSLQEMGGIHNSHALRLVEQERQRWQAEIEESAPQTESQPDPTGSAEVVPEQSANDGLDEAEPPRDVNPDEPFIETIRCTTCNECTEINPTMFAYNDNKQAYITDPATGTYRELVEAAENCQVSIIHPGKPGNQNEPGLDELLERAAPFI